MRHMWVIFAIAALLAPFVSHATPASDKLAARRSVEMLEKYGQGKDGAFSVTRSFAECQGMYDALADHIDESDDGHAIATNLRNTGNGAELVAKFFWSKYSENPHFAVKYISDAAKDHYAAILSVAGVSDEDMMEKMTYCASLTKLQASVLGQMRENY